MHHARVNAARAKELLIQHKGLLRSIVVISILWASEEAS